MFQQKENFLDYILNAILCNLVLKIVYFKKLFK